MSSALSVTLPALNTRYPGVPRRYEETRPVLVQEFTHKRIIGLGYEIHQKYAEKAEEEQHNAVHEAEQAVWAQVEHIKELAVQKAREEAQLEQERIMKKMQKSLQKAIKEEALRIEMAMQKRALEHVKLEKEEGERRLQQALKQVEVKAAKEKLEAVLTTREEERKIAAEEAARLARLSEEKLERALKEADDEMEEALTELCKAKDRECTRGAARAKGEERGRNAEEMAKVIVKYDIELAQLKIHMDIKLDEINRLLAKIEDQDKAKTMIKHELVKTRHSFQDYITRVGKFADGQADFLLRPVTEKVRYLTEQQEEVTA